MVPGSGTLRVTNSTLAGNSATLALLGIATGGAIYTNGGTLTVNSRTFSGNDAGSGDAVSNSGGTVTNSTFAGDDAGPGGAIFNDGGTLTVTNSTFAGNGAAISNGGGPVNVISSTFAGSAISNGGGQLGRVTDPPPEPLSRGCLAALAVPCHARVRLVKVARCLFGALTKTSGPQHEVWRGRRE